MSVCVCACVLDTPQTEGLDWMVQDEDSQGLKWQDTANYCTLDRNCDPAYSVAASWRIFGWLYALFSLLALYLVTLSPDSQPRHPAP